MTGLNAATVGIVALAAVRLSQKAVTDRLTRILVFLGATAGMLYKALWYFPILMFAGGMATIVWDSSWGQRLLRRPKPNIEDGRGSEGPAGATELRESASSISIIRRNPSGSSQPRRTSVGNDANIPIELEERTVPASMEMRIFSWSFGVMVLVGFFVTFAVTMILRGVLKNRPRGFNLFANLYLAGM